MAYRKWIVALVLGVLAGTVRSGDGGRRVLRRSTCTPTVSGAPASVFDGDVATFWRTPGQSQQQIVTIDLGCSARVFRFRRHMSCPGAAPGGPVCAFVNGDGRRHLGFDGVDFAASAAGPFQSAQSIGATGWEAYRSGQGFDLLPYGWTPWLDLKGVTARLVRFIFVDAGDDLNEIEIEYEEGSGATPGVSITEIAALSMRPGAITVGPDRALWFTENPDSGNERSGRVARLTTLGDMTEFMLPAKEFAAGITSDDTGRSLWFTIFEISPTIHGQIGRLTLSYDFAEFPLSEFGMAERITKGPDGNIWFTISNRELVGFVTPGGSVTEIPTAFGKTTTNEGIVAAPDGALWFGVRGPELGGSMGRVSTVGQVSKFESAGPVSDVAMGADGAIWCTGTGPTDAVIRRITTAGSVTSFPLAGPWGWGPITRGPDGNMWFGSIGRVGRITLAGDVTMFDLPDSGTLVRSMTAGPDGALWYTHTSPNGIGRIALVQGPDLGVTMTGAGTPAEGVITYEVKITNTGNQDATGVVVHQLIPVRTRFRAADSTAGWICSPDENGGGICTLPIGNLPRGAERSANFQVDFIGASGIPGSNLYSRATVADDRVHGPDLNLTNNDASTTIPEVEGEGCAGSPDFLHCCATELIGCFFFPDSGCAVGNPMTTPGRAPAARRKAGTALAVLQETARSLVLYYRIRDEVFAASPGGRRLTELYYRHDAEIKGLLLADTTLREEAFETLTAWAPTLQSLADREDGSPISQGHVDKMLGFLAALESKASPDLRNAIARERRDLGLENFTGLLPSAALARIDHFTCTPGDTTLCLNGGRFRVESSWTDFAGNTGAGHAVPMTGDTGSFWFFSPANIELTTKALDGRGVNGHYWFFYGALSNVAYTITVTDTSTGAVKTYTNPSGRFGSAGDAAAFPGGTSTAVRSPLERSPEAYRFSATACTANSTSLCLNGGRFRAEVAWRDFQGNTGTGHAVPLTSDTGTFWFFSSANVELVVKALDGRGFNNRYWLFYGALSNVEYTLTVTDTVTGAVKTYTNPSGTFASVGDTSAFVP